MTTEPTTTPPIEALVDAMLTSCGQLAAVFAHMERHRSTAPDAEPPAQVLGELLGGIFESLPARFGVESVDAAATIVLAATDLVGEELLLVNVDELEDEGRRRG